MKYPKIIKRYISPECHEVELTLFIPQEIIYFDGHFPGTPVLPGVVQVDWVIKFAAEIFKLDKTNVTSINQLKFTRVILPESTIILFLSLIDKRVMFKYMKGPVNYSSGKISF
ncbi:MAG: 3-hydroxymyristoyl/3-hydroxydecanoyl-(acyl carrier protein) dehydratase [Francisellaceae bacterium]|jgi:3-hydroxymyristoyl/3-hydroxydecanoyl-(acyl carrier protein) dehydratase